jgi:hypothetical protein
MICWPIWNQRKEEKAGWQSGCDDDASKHYNLRYLNNNEMTTKCQMIINSLHEFMKRDVVAPWYLTVISG